MAYKVFSNGDALTGGELNTYLMNQSVMVFASTTARDAALTTPNEGMVVWLQDSDKYVYYTGSAWADLISAAGSGNAIINGAFDIWQRGTSFTGSPTWPGTYSADRYTFGSDGGTSATVSRQTFTPGTAPVTGYEGQFFMRWAKAIGGNTANTWVHQRVEDVRSFAGQTVTLSFWAKADVGVTYSPLFIQDFGSGGSSQVNTTASSITLTTSWARYSVTVNVPSVTGKTIGTSSFLAVFPIILGQTGASTIDIWGLQLESGSTATAFKRNASNIQGELAACQRYYYTNGGTAVGLAHGFAYSSTAVQFFLPLPVTMRTAPISVTWSGVVLQDIATGTSPGISGIALTGSSTNSAWLLLTGSSGLTTYRIYTINIPSAGFIAISAEL